MSRYVTPTRLSEISDILRDVSARADTLGVSLNAEQMMRRGGVEPVVRRRVPRASHDHRQRVRASVA